MSSNNDQLFKDFCKNLSQNGKEYMDKLYDIKKLNDDD